MKELLNYKFVRFILTGLLNTCFGYGIFALFLYFKFHYMLALFLGAIIAILFSYKTIGTFVFETDKNVNVRLLKFFGAYFLLWIIASVILKTFAIFGVSYYVGYAIAIFPLALISFFMMKHFVFVDK